MSEQTLHTKAIREKKNGTGSVCPECFSCHKRNEEKEIWWENKLDRKKK